MILNVFEYPPLAIYCCVLAAVIGAVLGSFLNCAAWRIAHGESFVKGRSRCPSCGHTLGLPDLIPVFSWIFLGGKCRYCKTKVSVRYLLMELFMAAMVLLCFLQAGLSILFMRNLVFGCILLVLSLVDMEIYEIPDGCLLIGLIAWVAAEPFLFVSWTDLAMHLLAGLILGGAILFLSLLFDKLLKKESMGGGDIKLFALAGLYVGLVQSLFVLLFSCVVGLLLAALIRSRVSEAEGRIPFGPAIAITTWFVLLYGNYLADWYLGLLSF